jgi:hypothetical protein
LYKVPNKYNTNANAVHAREQSLAEALHIYMIVLLRRQTLIPFPIALVFLCNHLYGWSPQMCSTLIWDLVCKKDHKMQMSGNIECIKSIKNKAVYILIIAWYFFLANPYNYFKLLVVV